MMGAQNPSHLQGLIPRICNQLFMRVDKSKKKAAEGEAADPDGKKTMFVQRGAWCC